MNAHRAGLCRHRRPDEPPERDLWLAVLLLAFQDLSDQRPNIRQNALEFIHSVDLLKVMDLVGIPRDMAPLLRDRAQNPAPLCSLSSREKKPPRGITRLEFRGEKHTIQEWARITGLTATAIYNRLYRGWSIERVLSPERRRA